MKNQTNTEFSIPGFTGYTIDKFDHIYSRRSGEKIELKQRIAQNGYRSVTVTRDDGRRTTEGIHYLKALAFKSDTRKSDQNEVNHIDGNKLNNDISNLEWCTRSHNEQHKVNNLLTKRAKPVVIENMITGEKRIAPSTRAAARILNVPINTVNVALRYVNTNIVRDSLVYTKEV